MRSKQIEKLYTELTTDNTKPRTIEQLLNVTRALLAKRKFTGDSSSVRRRQHTEETIVLAVAQVLLDAGFLLGVNDGEETTLHHSNNIAEIQKALFTTDEDYLYIYEPLVGEPWALKAAQQDETPDFWVRCIYGNDGYDVISDYSSVADLDKYLGTGSAIEQLSNMAEEGRL